MGGESHIRSMVLSNSNNKNDKKNSLNQLLLKSYQNNNNNNNNNTGSLSQQKYHHSHNFSTGGPNGPPTTFYGRTGSVQPPYRQSNNNPSSGTIVSRETMMPGSANKKKQHRTQTPNRSISKGMQKSSTIYVPGSGAGGNLANISTGISSSVINTATKRYLKKFQTSTTIGQPNQTVSGGDRGLKSSHPNSKLL